MRRGLRHDGPSAMLGCGGSGEVAAALLDAAPPDAKLEGATDNGESRADWPATCERGGDNVVLDVFCGAAPAAIADLESLQGALGLVPDPPAYGTFATLLAHSTALSGRLVSPINPRAILLGNGVAMAFQRGVQQVELAVRSRKGGAPQFYLVTFEQACNGQRDGCTPGDLFTPRIEHDWRDVALLDAEDLKNTPSDCRQCHQRGLAQPVFLMRELLDPWTHFFGGESEQRVLGLPGVQAADLVQDFRDAHGDEPYAGLTRAGVRSALALFLQTSVDYPQPLYFDVGRIFAERWPQADNGYSDTPERSPTWDRAYAAFKRGEQLALPYFAGRATDPDKQAALSKAYARYRAGELSEAELPDLSDIFPDDPQVRAEIGLQSEPGAEPADALIQACGACHNDVLDQTLSRARFNIDLARMSRAQRELAAERIALPDDDDKAMPPREARQLDPSARKALIDYLQASERPAADDDKLARAARLGMAGGAITLQQLITP